MRPVYLVPALLAGLSTLAIGQKTVVIPTGAATAEGTSSTSYPFNTSNTKGHRIQYCYSAASVPSTAPVLIQKLRFRANGSTTTWTGGTYAKATIQMSTAKTKFNAMTTTFASNHGADLTTVYSGTITVKPAPTTGNTSPGIWYVDVPLTKAFLYDNTKGDLLFDITLPGPRTGGTSYYHDVFYTTTPSCYRMYSYSDASATTGSGPYTSGMVMELSYVPATGLWPDFSADKRIGAAPLTVKFTDKTYTSDPGGVKTWAWDFDGDNKVDSTVQNPTFIYKTINKTATYDVTLTVTDAKTPAGKTLTKKSYITIDPPPVADFDASPRSGAVRKGLPPVIVKFKDLSVGATAWAWDFNGDNKVDSTLQNPTYPYIFGGKYTVSLEVTGVGGKHKVTKKDFIIIKDYLSLTTLFAGGNGGSSGWGNFFDLEVKDANGLWITGLDVNCSTANANVQLDVYITPTTYVGKDATATAWKLISTGYGKTGTVTNPATPTEVDMADFFLAKGKYGVAVYYKGSGMSYTNGTATNNAYSNTEMALKLGISKTGLFSGSTFSPRIWNGTIRYVTKGWPSIGVYGLGCKGTNGIPTLAVGTGNTVVVGGKVNFDLASMPTKGGAAIIINGASKDKFLGTVPLPLKLDSAGATGCQLLSDYLFTLGVANVGGTGSFTLPIPTDTTLVGVRMYNQALVIDLPANSFGMTFTNGGEFQIGN